MSYFIAFLGFAALIILHEGGHFVAAKAVGMRVERFSLFFGPLLFKFRRGETEYGIAPIPLGGYVRITGMNPNEEIPAEVAHRAYYNCPPWQRIVVILAGPTVNLLLAFVLMFAVFMSEGAVQYRHGQPVPVIERTGLEQPAASYLKPGDVVIAVDGKSDLSGDQITSEIASHRCAGTPTAGCRASTPVVLTVKRGDRTLQIPIRPRYDASRTRMRIGIELGALTRPIGAGTAVSHSLSQMWYVTHTTVSTIATIFEPKQRQQLHGVVGGFKVTQQAVAFSTAEAVYVLALISLSLAVVNLFPFLPLDGGHVFWALAEKVRGRRIPFVVMERAGALGFVLILFIFVIGLSNDISTLSGPGFNIR